MIGPALSGFQLNIAIRRHSNSIRFASVHKMLANEKFALSSPWLLLLVILSIGLQHPSASAQPTAGLTDDGMDQNITLPDGSVRNVRDYLTEFVRDYKRVRANHTPAQMRHASTVGLLAGLVRVELLMQAALSNRTHRFQHEFDASTAEQVLEHLFQLEQQMQRDRKAVELLGNALDVATNVRTFEAFRADADRLLREAVTAQLEANRRKQAAALRAGKELGGTGAGQMRVELKRRMAETSGAVERHQRELRTTVKRRVQATVGFLKKEQQQLEIATTDSTTDPTTDRPYEAFSAGSNVLGQVSSAFSIFPG